MVGNFDGNQLFALLRNKGYHVWGGPLANHGFVFLRMMEEQICEWEEKKGKRKEQDRKRKEIGNLKQTKGKQRGNIEETERKGKGKEGRKGEEGLSVVWGHFFEQIGIAKVSL